jgi:UDP-N-acetylglucosamine diphosphorylase / glucose-1-phosphate thymidylyltransferase / UDP-N-acetylgalactosamine diphosphorylase / glucosamine-1-phosphate N-acetyltransferase / galactosamine-1-phosphate N-acetyltransferase
MRAIVMAAGEGRRLRPLTERYAKAVLPIDGRPVVAVLLRELESAGLGPITVVVGHRGDQIESLLAGFDADLRFVGQAEPLGSADAVRRAEADPPYVVVAADTAFSSGDIAGFVQASTGADGAIAVRRSPPPGPGRAAVRVESGRITRVIDDDPSNPLGGAPLWFIGGPVHAEMAGLPGPPFQLAEAFRRALAAGADLRGVEIGPTRDLTFPLDLLVENFPYLRSIGEG